MKNVFALCAGSNIEMWCDAFQAIAPDIEVWAWPNIPDPAAVRFAVAWGHERGSLARFPNLEVVSSTGAGVDHLIEDGTLGARVRILRIVDEDLLRQMREYVIMMVLALKRGLFTSLERQRAGVWIRERELVAHENFCVGVMGLGALGLPVAESLARLGIRTAGWSLNRKEPRGVTAYSGAGELGRFCAALNVVVCLLPLTAATRSILNRNLFRMLPQGAQLINVGRGGHLVDADLIAALDEGQLSRAVLDVFAHEPLAPEHPFWKHPRIIMTPHTSAITDVHRIAAQIVENFRKFERGEPLVNEVNRARGY